MERWRGCAQQEGTGDAHSAQSVTKDARFERLQINRNVWQLRQKQINSAHPLGRSGRMTGTMPVLLTCRGCRLGLRTNHPIEFYLHFVADTEESAQKLCRLHLVIAHFDWRCAADFH